MTTPSAEPPGTAALLVNSRGEHLLHRDANKPWICDPGTWSIPGGDREGKESCRQAVERELYEETGLLVAPQQGTAFLFAPRAGGAR
ncbi:NUDIX domain-containing protein [Streptomyces sp. NPDC002602]|uniref:NUDIX domain-containing protein n=1 Tax=Streptomyces sp. NPDC002602 TaxID=3364654 RepID=UPI0036938F1D